VDPLIIHNRTVLYFNKKAQLSLTRKHAKLAPIRRAYNVVADDTGLSSFV